jgi:ABC-2 type transport system permease protein
MSSSTAVTSRGFSTTEPAPARGYVQALLLHALRLSGRSALVVVVVAAGMSAVVVWQFRGLAADGFDGSAMQALAQNPAIRIMFGNPVALDDPGGFTVWRTGTPVAILVAAWSALAAVRITRGEEQAGRWALLLAGPLRLPSLVCLHLSVIIGAAGITGTAVTLAMVAAGTSTSGALLYGAALALIGAGAAGWGGVAGQLAGDRRRAGVLAAAGIGAALLVRMVADSSETLSGLHWVTPFGLLGLTEPFSAQRLGPLVVLGLAGVVLVVTAGLTSRRRDVGAGVLPARDRPVSRRRGFRSLPGFAIRRGTGPLAAWATGIWSYFLVVGLLASALTAFLVDNPLFAGLAAQAGFGSLTTVAGYLASLFTLLAVPLGLFAAGRIGAVSDDEEARLLTVVFATPVTRRRWFLTEAVTAATGAAILAVGAGLAAWSGAAAVGTDTTPAAAVGGALNVLPIAWLSLGAALAAYGWLPRATLVLGSLPAVGGFLLHVLAETLRWPPWLANLSPYQHLRAVPYESVDWIGAIGMSLVAVALAGIGLLGFQRRDLRG